MQEATFIGKTEVGQHDHGCWFGPWADFMPRCKVVAPWPIKTMPVPIYRRCWRRRAMSRVKMDLVPMGLAMTTATYLITADQVRMVPTAATVTTLFTVMLVPAMPTKVVQTHATASATQSTASGARARPA